MSLPHLQDPRFTLGILALVSIAIMSVHHTWQLHLLMGLSALYLVSLRRFSAAIAYVLMYLLFGWLVLILPTRVGSVTVFLIVTMRMMPMLVLGTVLFSTPPNAILTVGDRMHVPQQAMIAVCVLFRFMHVICQEMHAIVQGIRARGLLPHWYSVVVHPVQSYGCFVLPLIIRGLKLSSELACAADFRGVESTALRTCIYSLKVMPNDVTRTAGYVVCCMGVVLAGRLA